MFNNLSDLQFIQLLIDCYNQRKCIKLEWIGTDLNDLLELKSAVEFNHLTDSQREKIKYFREDLSKHCANCPKSKV